MDSLNNYYYNKDADYSEKFKKKVRIVRGAIYFLLAAASVLMYFFKLRLPMLPKHFTTEMSLFPELLLTFAYGPLYGIAVSFVKHALHILIAGNTMITDAANFIVEALFLLIAGAFYAVKAEKAAERTTEKLKKAPRAKLMLGGSVIAAVAALIIQFLLTVFLMYPMLMEKYSQVYSKEGFIQSYNAVLDGIRAHLPNAVAGLIPGITAVWQGVLLVNLPVSLLKFAVVTVLAMIAYLLCLPLLYVKIPKNDYPF